MNGVDRTSEMTNLELRLYYPIERHTSVPTILFMFILFH